jgi:hypothetical protein
LHCTVCKGYFQETHGTPWHGKRVALNLLVWAVGALAEGLGIRAVARVFEVDPNTVLQWLVEAADHLKAFSQYFLHDVRVTQVQLDELYALLSAVKAGEISDHEAIQRLSRAPHWVWVAMDPVTKVLLTLDVGDRTLAMAQGVVHQVIQVLAPDYVPAGPRPCAETALDAPARAALCAGGQDRAAAPSGPREASGRVWHAGGDPAGACGLRLADQHRLR